jgi:glycosyltransferase involved in cell wall biosynthesis
MNVLMVAPEPIFEPRGTPLSVVGRLKALSDLGHSVDLATYSMGEDVVFPGLKILRTIRIPGIRRVKIGPSLAKIPLDILLFMKTVVRLLKSPYDLIHTHEEACFWGVFLSRVFRVPHIYDMHSSLPQQLKNFQFSDSKILVMIFDKLERWVIKHADCIITICPDLYDYVYKMFSEKGSILIENVVDYGMIFGEKDLSSEIRKDLNLEGKRVALYTGTFEPYQGLELLISSASKVVSKVKSAFFIMVGGHSDQVAFYREKVRESRLENHFVFTGQVAPQEVNSYIRCADVLLSPRISGTNTPLKIYGYLRSGVPIVATRLPTHTQVLDDDVAVLTEPTAEGFAQGIISVITDGNLSSRIGSHGAHLADGRYSYSIYLDKFTKAIQQAMTKEV